MNFRISVDGAGPSYEDVFNNYIAKNKPFILTGQVCVDKEGNPWEICDKWLTHTYNESTGHLDVDYIRSTYG